MGISRHHPRRSGYGDVFSVFILIMSIAIGSQAYTDINRYAALRADGVVVDGYWTGQFINPADGEAYGIYYFTVGNRTYSAQQLLGAGVEYTGNSNPVSIIYLPDDPSLSRISGTEAYNVASLLLLIICIIVALLSLQYFIAYYTARESWISILDSRVLKFRAAGKGFLTTRTKTKPP